MGKRRIKPKLSPTLLLFYYMNLKKRIGKENMKLVHQFAVAIKKDGEMYFIKCNCMDEEFFMLNRKGVQQIFYSLKKLDEWIFTAPSIPQPSSTVSSTD